eukprot:3935925-Rhodomonas_salina.3
MISRVVGMGRGQRLRVVAAREGQTTRNPGGSAPPAAAPRDQLLALRRQPQQGERRKSRR